MCGLKFTLFDAISLLPDNLSGLKKYIYSDLRQSHEFGKNEQMQMVFTTEEFLEVATESWSEWDLNPQHRSRNTLNKAFLFDRSFLWC